MARPTKPKILKDWEIGTLEKARAKEIPSDPHKREAFVEKAISEFHSELKNAIATEQAFRALCKHWNAAKPHSQPMFDVAPNFWKVTAYGLFSSSISTVARIFDNKQGYGLQWCLGVCRRCCDVFTREATLARLKQGSDDLSNYIAPDEQYFEELYQATKPCWKYFYEHFHPMRNYWIGHRILADDESASLIADKFVDAELDAFFGRLAQLDRALRQCFYRGNKLSATLLDAPAAFNTAMQDETDQLFSLTSGSH